ncbi:tRNA (adenosine(37)-N6)-threonylcarbamoyltransferase complex ATPase subunit type 1 TsaE [Arenicellales bacterium nBUS_45]
MTREIIVNTPCEMEAVGYELAHQISAPCTVHLRGDLGAGKTTLAKGIIVGMGAESQVVSPTYTLVEEYQTAKGEIHHIDLYRMKTAGEA